MGELIESLKDNGRISGNAVLVLILLSTIGMNIAHSSMEVPSDISFGMFNTTHSTDEDGSHHQNITSSQQSKVQKSPIKSTIQAVFQPIVQVLNNFKHIGLIQAYALDNLPFRSAQHAYLSLFYLF